MNFRDVQMGLLGVLVGALLILTLLGSYRSADYGDTICLTPSTLNGKITITFVGLEQDCFRVDRRR